MDPTPDEHEPKPDAAVPPDAAVRPAAQGPSEAPPESDELAGLELTEPAFVERSEPGEVLVRRAPRYGRFLAIGAVLGIVAALVLTFAFPENDRFDRGQVFGFLLLVGATVGVALGGLVAILLDRAATRRARSAIVEHERRRSAD